MEAKTLIVSVLRPITSGRLLRERAYDVLRDAILRLELKPGESLTERELAQQLGVSKSPIRDALIRLDQEGLVRSTPFKGFEVATLSEEDVRNSFQFREAIELYCVEHFLRQAPDSKIAELESTHEEQRRLLEAGDIMRAFEKSRFHPILVESLDNPIFRLTNRIVGGHLRRVQNLATIIPGRLRKTHEEHEHILNRIRARDVTGTQEAMRRHFRSVCDDTLASGELRKLSSGSQRSR